jgi:O-antigen/teichoic acid export membrane protein
MESPEESRHDPAVGGPARGDEGGDGRERGGGDLTGRDRLASNVLAGWGAYFVIAVAGFLAPRVMDRRLGQETVGIWDFGWSLVTYLGLTALGVGSSVNRNVARYRAAGDTERLSRVVSSATVINAASGAAALLLTGIFVWFLPRMLSADLADRTGEARLVVLLLGGTIALSLSFQAFQGVLVGCHRFDVTNAINAGFEVTSSVAIVVVLLSGGGLVAAASVCIITAFGAELMRLVWARRVCPELRIRRSNATWSEMKRLFRFGIKTMVEGLSGLLLIQANKLLVGSSLGLAELAVFSRPLALTRIVESFGTRLANVLPPTASSLQRTGRDHELRQLVLSSTRLGVATVLPMSLVLAILGDPIMILWMGRHYTPGAFLVVLVLGSAGPLALRPVVTILQGLDRHGRPALATLVAAASSTLLGLANASFLHWGLLGAALGIALPMIGLTVFLAWYACRMFHIRPGELFRESFWPPLLCAAPFALILAASRIAFRDAPALAIIVGTVAGAALLLPLSWRMVLPEDVRGQVRTLAARFAAPLASRLRHLRGERVRR